MSEAPPVDGVKQYLGHVFDDRRIVNFLGDHVRLRLGIPIGDLQVDVIANHLVERLRTRFPETPHQTGKLVVLDNDGFHRHAGGELDLLQNLLVGRIGHRDKQAIAAFLQRHYATAGDHFLVNQRNRNLVYIYRVQVKKRQSKGIRRKEGNLLGRQFLGCHELFDKTDAGLRRLSLYEVGVGLNQFALLNQGTTKRAEVCGSGGHLRGNYAKVF